MSECMYCGDEIEGRGVHRNEKRYCSTECADLDEEEYEEEEFIGGDEDDFEFERQEEESYEARWW